VEAWRVGEVSVLVALVRDGRELKGLGIKRAERSVSTK
jgi:hypothetical protein